MAASQIRTPAGGAIGRGGGAVGRRGLGGRYARPLPRQVYSGSGYHEKHERGSAAMAPVASATDGGGSRRRGERCLAGHSEEHGRPQAKTSSPASSRWCVLAASAVRCRCRWVPTVST